MQRAGMVLRNSAMTSDEVSRVFQESGIILSEEDIVTLMSGSAGGEGGSQENRKGYQLRAIAAAVEKILRESFAAGILNVERSAFSPLPTRFSIRHRGLEVFENSEFILGLQEMRQQVPERLRINQQLNDAQSKIGYKMALAFLSPNLIYDQAETQTRMEEAVALVPLAKDQVLAGERIIDCHERITREHIEKLNSYAAAKTERGEGKGLITRILHGLGQWGNSLFILSILLFFLWQGRGEIANAPKQLLLIALIVLLITLVPDPYMRILRFVSDGIWVTFYVTMISFVLVLIFGLIGGLGRLSKVNILKGIATTYVEIVRGIPLMVQLYFWYFATPGLIRGLGGAIGSEALTNYKAEPILMAIIGLTFCYSAYMSEVYRAGIQSISKGQMEAARSLGMTYFQAMRHVILPQAVRVILPPVGNEFITLLKDSSLVSVVAVADMTRRGREFQAATFTSIEPWIMVALLYLVMTLFSARIVTWIERKTRLER